MSGCICTTTCKCQSCETEREQAAEIARLNSDLIDERLQQAANAKLYETQSRVIVQMRIALQGELMQDGCVRSCPTRLSSDAPHNLRCTQVRAALRDSA